MYKDVKWYEWTTITILFSVFVVFLIFTVDYKGSQEEFYQISLEEDYSIICRPSELYDYFIVNCNVSPCIENYDKIREVCDRLTVRLGKPKLVWIKECYQKSRICYITENNNKLCTPCNENRECYWLYRRFRNWYPSFLEWYEECEYYE